MIPFTTIRWRWVTATILGTTLGLWAGRALAQDWSGIDAKLSTAVVRVESGSLRDRSFCTGVVINREKDYVLTAAHCIDEDGSIAVNGRHAVVVKDDGGQKVNLILDLAILKVPGLGASREVPPFDGEPHVGLPVAITGFGLAATKPLYTFGWLSGELEGSVVIPLNGKYGVDSSLIPGQSGGAVVDTGGRLVSLVQLRLFVGFGPTPRQIRDFACDYFPTPKKP